jgi:hypothetical protein
VKETKVKLTYQAILDNPELLARILADAKRERARAIAALLRRPAKADKARTAAALSTACS